MEKERFGNIFAGFSTAIILIIAFIAKWRFNVTYFLDRIFAFLELGAWIIGLGFGIAIIFIIIRMFTIGFLDLISWVVNKFYSNKE